MENTASKTFSLIIGTSIFIILCSAAAQGFHSYFGSSSYASRSVSSQK